jgi:hypothetical protein
MVQAVHIKPILCVFAKLFYCSGYKAPAMQYQQACVTDFCGQEPRVKRREEPQKLLVSALVSGVPQRSWSCTSGK